MASQDRNDILRLRRLSWLEVRGLVPAGTAPPMPLDLPAATESDSDNTAGSATARDEPGDEVAAKPDPDFSADSVDATGSSELVSQGEVAVKTETATDNTEALLHFLNCMSPHQINTLQALLNGIVTPHAEKYDPMSAKDHVAAGPSGLAQQSAPVCGQEDYDMETNNGYRGEVSTEDEKFNPMYVYASDFAKLDDPRQQKSETDQEEDAVVCSVCLEGIPDAVIKTCRHAYCVACIDEMKGKMPCPKCKRLFFSYFMLLW